MIMAFLIPAKSNIQPKKGRLCLGQTKHSTVFSYAMIAALTRTEMWPGQTTRKLSGHICTDSQVKSRGRHPASPGNKPLRYCSNFIALAQYPAWAYYPGLVYKLQTKFRETTDYSLILLIFSRIVTFCHSSKLFTWQTYLSLLRTVQPWFLLSLNDSGSPWRPLKPRTFLLLSLTSTACLNLPCYMVWSTQLYNTSVWTCKFIHPQCLHVLEQSFPSSFINQTKIIHFPIS